MFSSLVLPLAAELYAFVAAHNPAAHYRYRRSPIVHLYPFQATSEQPAVQGQPQERLKSARLLGPSRNLD
jgi:hypothetical protein